MTTIKINTFGGIMPSVESRNLPPESAQTAHNLSLRYGDFRPLKGPGASVATVTAGTKSIFRTPSGVWLHSTNDVNYVNGQINDAASERVYLTGRTVYPEAWQSAAYRRLGVPAPAGAPTTTVTVGEEFSEQDFDEAAGRATQDVVAAVVAARTALKLGNPKPTNGGTLGGLWLSHGDDSELPTPDDNYISFVVPATVSGSTVTITAASDQYLTDPSLGGKSITYTPPLGSPGTYWAVAPLWFAQGYSVDASALATALEALTRPPENVDPLFTTAQATAIADRIAGLYAAANDPVAAMLNTINQRQFDVINQLLRTDTNPTRAYATLAAGTSLASAVVALNQYFATLNGNIFEEVAAILRPYAFVLPAATQLQYETRGYIYTYVSEWGEESAPSPPSDLLELDQNDSVEVTIPSPTVTSPYGTITHWRLYRSSTTSVGAAYQLVEEVAIGTLTYDDTKLQEELQETCPSATWVEPPANLKGLVGLPNGIMAGFFGKTLCFSEPFAPYAWPVEYQITVEYNIVGLGVFGQTLVVLTEGNPYYASGADSASMSAQKLESTQACVSKRSIVSVEGGVIYASPDGICIAGPSGVELLTLGAYSRDDWQALGAANSFAAFSEGVYYIVMGVSVSAGTAAGAATATAVGQAV